MTTPNPEGTGLPISSEDRMATREQLIERRQIIKNIIEERGWKSMTELHNILTSEYTYQNGTPIAITRQTLYNDLNQIGKEMDIVGRESSNLIASYRMKQREIDDLLKKCKDMKDKIQLYKLWTQYAKDYSVVLGRLGATASANEKGGESQKEEINVSFK